jgi:hypothetical protein
MSGLEDRYRRLLRWYPADHRRAHEDEMLGVLLAAAAPTRTRPAVRDALGLALGGLGVRLRRAPGVRAEAGRRDAAGLLGVIAPLVLLGEAVRYAVFAILMLPEASYAAAYGARWSDMYSAAPAHLAWAVVAVAGLRGARRTTAVAVLAAIALDVVRFADLGDYAGEAAAGPLLLGLITAGALLAEPGTARGRVLPGRTDVGIAGLLAVVAPLDPTSARAALGIDWGTGRVGVTIAALAAATWMARGPAGRRALILLAMPLLPFVAAPYYPGYSDDPLGRYLITMVVIPVAIGLTALGTIVAAEKLSRVAE